MGSAALLPFSRTSTVHVCVRVRVRVCLCVRVRVCVCVCVCVLQQQCLQLLPHCARSVCMHTWLHAAGGMR